MGGKETRGRGWRRRLHEVIFGADTFGGKLFDVALIAAIVLSVVVVMLDSMPSVNARFGTSLLAAEWLIRRRRGMV